MDLRYLNAINLLAPARPDLLTKLAERFGEDWEKAWHSSELKSYLGPKAGSPKEINPDKEYKKLERADIWITTINDSLYPPLLKQIFDPPWLLYYQGKLEALTKPCLAVVGSRAATEYGKRATLAITKDLARAGFTIISGLARGIDGHAHRATIEARGVTVAVLGGELATNSIVQENQTTAKQILKTGGGIISEYPLGIEAQQFTFPQRNRIVSGLSKGVIVVEATLKSGALITARLAAEQGRDVFAVPGPIFSNTSTGTNMLIQNGAKAVQTATDILTEYQTTYTLAKPVVQGNNPTEDKILATIGTDTRSLDEIIRACQLPAPAVIAALMNLELDDKVTNLGNNRFILKT